MPDNCWELALAAPILSSPICSSESYWSDFSVSFWKRCWRRQMTSLWQKTQPCNLHTAACKHCAGAEIYAVCGYCVFLNMQWDLFILQEETGLRGCLRPTGTSRKLAVSIPDGVIRNLCWFQRPCPRERTPVPVEKRLGGPQCPSAHSETEKKFHVPVGIRTAGCATRSPVSLPTALSRFQ